MKNYLKLHFSYLIPLIILLLACQESNIKKLDDSYLLGNSLSKEIKGNISSLYFENIYHDSYPEHIDSITLYEIINKKLDEISKKDLKEKRILFSKEGKIIFNPGYVHNVFFKYNDSGLLSEISTRGTQSNRLYYREYFQYNMDTTECIAKSYIMKKVKPQNYDDYDKYPSFEIADSIYWAGPDTTNYLYSETNYQSTTEGLLIHKITYIETDTMIEEFTLTKVNLDKTLKMVFRYTHDNRPRPFLKNHFYKNNKLIRRQSYAIKNLVPFKEFPDFIENTPDLFKFFEKNQVEISGLDNFNLKESELATSDSHGNNTNNLRYIYDDQGNWIAKIYVYPKTKKYGDVTLRHIEYY